MHLVPAPRCEVSRRGLWFLLPSESAMWGPLAMAWGGGGECGPFLLLSWDLEGCLLPSAHGDHLCSLSHVWSAGPVVPSPQRPAHLGVVSGLRATAGKPPCLPFGKSVVQTHV